MFNLQWGLEYQTLEYRIHWKTKRFEVQISKGSEQNCHLLFKTEWHWRTEGHWKTKQRSTIGILNMFGIPAPTVFEKKINSFIISVLVSCIHHTATEEVDLKLYYEWCNDLLLLAKIWTISDKVFFTISKKIQIVYVTSFSSISYWRISEMAFFQNVTNIMSSNWNIHVST